MGTTVTAEVEHAPVFDLDLEKLGAIIRMLPAISVRVGHNSTRATLGYGAPTTPESEFIRDVLSLKTSEIVEKWYGGYENAGRLAAAGAEAATALIPRKRRPLAAAD